MGKVGVDTAHSTESCAALYLCQPSLVLQTNKKPKAASYKKQNFLQKAVMSSRDLAIEIQYTVQRYRDTVQTAIAA